MWDHLAAKIATRLGKTASLILSRRRSRRFTKGAKNSRRILDWRRGIHYNLSLTARRPPASAFQTPAKNQRSPCTVWKSSETWPMMANSKNEICSFEKAQACSKSQTAYSQTRSRIMFLNRTFRQRSILAQPKV